jgi:hypothetical protein
MLVFSFRKIGYQRLVFQDSFFGGDEITKSVENLRKLPRQRGHLAGVVKRADSSLRNAFTLNFSHVKKHVLESLELASLRLPYQSVNSAN